ncbi:MAG: DivIVA domain-containing protein [Defluviitaleaceae bacterium]|nr:DivIVA domain-containing protein [Defluviitaleaceae bacterium]
MEKLFNIVKRGYDQDEVDNYIQTLEALIKSYKDKDDTIKNAIINAQISADNIIKNAEIESERIKKRAVKLLDEIHTSIDGQKKVANNFQEEYNRLVTKYLQNIGNAEIEKVLEKMVELEQYVTSMQKMHDTSDQHTVPGSGDIPKMVVGVQSSKPAPQVQSSPQAPPPAPAVAKKAGDDDMEDDTVALVAELLARDRSKN